MAFLTGASAPPALPNDIIVDTSGGSQELIGTNDADTISGGSGDDTLRGLGVDDLLRGGLDHNSLFGDDGADRLFGQAGDDVLVGGAGKDQFIGGDGTDTVDFGQDCGAGPVTVDLSVGIATDSFGNSEFLRGIEAVIGSAFGDLLLGSAGDD
jgi:Ca2+-binding RTX toxin-like protein